jgi:hypothetical protein
VRIGAIPDAVTHPGYSYKTSIRWFPGGPDKNRDYGLPYITNAGRITNSIVYRWKCQPSQIVTTLISTVHSRLLKVMLKRIGKRAFKSSHFLLKCAAYYVLTRDDYFLSRILGAFKNRSEKPAKGVLRKCEPKMDDKTRFVYRQLCFQSNWLTSRAERPRDKSRFRVLLKRSDGVVFTTGVEWVTSHEYKRILRPIARQATVFWVSIKTPKIRQHTGFHLVTVDSRRLPDNEEQRGIDAREYLHAVNLARAMGLSEPQSLEKPPER